MHLNNIDNNINRLVNSVRHCVKRKVRFDKGRQKHLKACERSHGIWLPIGSPSHTISDWISVGLCSVSTDPLANERLAHRILELGCLACAVTSMLVVSAYTVRGCKRWLSDLAVTEDSSEFVQLKLIEHFHMTTLGDPCLTVM